jgi:hypothetical protein
VKPAAAAAPAKAALAVGGVFWALLGVYLPCQGLLLLLVLLAAVADSCPVRDTCTSTTDKQLSW